MRLAARAFGVEGVVVKGREDGDCWRVRRRERDRCWAVRLAIMVFGMVWGMGFGLVQCNMQLLFYLLCIEFGVRYGGREVLVLDDSQSTPRTRSKFGKLGSCVEISKALDLSRVRCWSSRVVLAGREFRLYILAFN